MKTIRRSLTVCVFAGALLGAVSLPASAAAQSAKPTAAQQQDDIPTPQQAARQINAALTELTQTLTHIQDKTTADTAAARVSVLFDIVGGYLILSEVRGGDYPTEISKETRKAEPAFKQQVLRLREKVAYNSRLLAMAMPGMDYTSLPELTEEDRAAQHRLQESEQARLPELLSAVHDETSADAAAIAISTLIKRDFMLRRPKAKAKTLLYIEKQLPRLLKGSEAEVERLRSADCFGSVMLKHILMPQVVEPTISTSAQKQLE